MDADPELTQRAAELCKCDLVSEMVLEFPELQGIAGSLYAAHDGEPQAVAEAIQSHYLPRFAGDQLPGSNEASAVALADRVDTLVGISASANPRQGRRTPLRLRRASLGVIRILIERSQPLPLNELITLRVRAAYC